MFDNVGRTLDPEARARGLAASAGVALAAGFLATAVLCYGAVHVAEHVVSASPDDEELVEVSLGDDAAPELIAPAPPPPPPPPPPAVANVEPDEPEPPTIEPDQLVDEPTPLRDPPPQAQVSAAHVAGVDGGVDGGDPRGILGGILGGYPDGAPGSQLGGGAPAAVHHTELRFKRPPQPDYPEAARTMNLGEVRCRVRIFIDEAGEPYDVHFEACPRVFHESAREAIYRARWYPARDGRNQKIKAQFLLNLVYRLR